jgi:hypothetical protein
MRRLLVLPVLVAAAALSAWLASSQGAGAARGPEPKIVPVRLGDRIRVVDAPMIGCRVVRMSQLGGRVVIDCRRAGPLAGTYGTLLTAREAALIRFESRHTAKRVAEARHDGSMQRCEAQ